MPYASLLVEALRARPAFMFWVAALAQAALWTLVPALFYASPPREVIETLVVGREWQTASVLGPPLAPWLAELAFRAAGNSVIGTYVLSQLCVVVTLWAVFRLGRAVVGPRHAVLAVLLMTGIYAFTVPTVGFNAGVLAMPFTALALLAYWRAVGDGRPAWWFVLALALALLAFTTYGAVVLLVLLGGFTLVTPRGRWRLVSPWPWLACALLIAAVVPYVLFLDRSGIGAGLLPASLPTLDGFTARLPAWGKYLGWLLLGHSGLVVLAVIAGMFVGRLKERTPTIDREPIGRFAKLFVFVFALAPALAAALVAAALDWNAAVTGQGALILLSGLAVVVAAGDMIRVHRQHLIGWAWLWVLLVPPLLAVAALVALPFVSGMDPQANRPAAQMGRFFAETFERRTGKPLEVVAGPLDLAGLVAVAASSRPSVLIDARPTPWLTLETAREKGTIVLWTVGDGPADPPAAYKAQFPDLVPEVPQTFERSVRGRLPPYRIGWGLVRPKGP